MAQVSQQLTNFVKDKEKFIPKAYWDYSQWTNGYGTKALSSSEVVSEPEAERRLKIALQRAVDHVVSIVKVPLNPNQLDALASLAFNTGSLGQFRKLMGFLNAGNYNAAANEFLDIDKSTTGERLPGLTIRRRQERDMFLSQSSGTINPTPTSSDNSLGSLLTNPGQVIQQALGNLSAGIQSVLLTGTNCPPPEFTQQARIIYPGCIEKTNNPIFGNGLSNGASAPGVVSIKPSNADTNNSAGAPYTGELKPGSFISPMKKGTYRVSSPYGMRKGRMHRGIDLAAPMLTPIYAPADGKVTAAALTGITGYGSWIRILHSGNIYTTYGHIEKIYVTINQQVTQGTLIAGIGTRGFSTGPHLHYQIEPNNVPVDPIRYTTF